MRTTKFFPDVLAIGIVCWICGAGALAQDNPVDPLARVNGSPIYEKNLVLDKTGIIRPLQIAIDHQLIAQQAETEGIEKPDRGPPFKQMLAQEEQRQSIMLGTIYEKKLRSGLEKEVTVTKAEIDACLIEHADYFAKVNPKFHRQEARSVVTRLRKATAYGDWLKTLLADIQLAVSGDAIPSALIDQAVESTIAMQGGGGKADQGAPLCNKITELVLASEAKARAVDPAELAGDPELVEKILADAVLTVNGKDVVLSNMPGSDNISSQALDTGADVMLVLNLKGLVLAAEAQEKGFDKDPETVALMADATKKVNTLSDVVSSRNAFVDPALIQAYYEAHGLTAESIEVTDEELDTYYVAVMRTVMGSSADDNAALRQHLNAAKQEILPEELTDDELQSWQILITRSFLNDGGKGAFHDQVAAVKLEWTRRAHLEELRNNADIEILVDLD
ncbi:MAG: hypothetical protein QF541_19810 [Lentisphaeria bacterium]|nr:hypothetical protein [Lentisphaeria bacterium]